MTSPMSDLPEPSSGSDSRTVAPTSVTLPPALPKPALPSWRLWVPLLLQTVLILSVPAPAVLTHLTGKTVVLQTVPVDPYDLLRGYYVTLSYKISQLETLRNLPGWESVSKFRTDGQRYLAEPTRFYVILQAPQATQAQIPQPWKPVRLSPTLPRDLPVNQIALQAQVTSGSINYGLENYYIPEDQRQSINQNINQAQQRPNQERSGVVVEAKVNAQGYAVPVGLWLRSGTGTTEKIHHYRF